MMKELCFCGREAALEDRLPVSIGGTTALRCPRCGHLDDLTWLPDTARRSLLNRAQERRYGAR